MQSLFFKIFTKCSTSLYMYLINRDKYFGYWHAMILLKHTPGKQENFAKIY